MEDRSFDLQKNECVCREGKQKTIESALLGQKVIWPRFRLTGIAVKAVATSEPRTTRKKTLNERQMNENALSPSYSHRNGIRESSRLMHVWRVSAFNIKFIKRSPFLFLPIAPVPSSKQAEINLLCGRSQNRDVCVRERQGKICITYYFSVTCTQCSQFTQNAPLHHSQILLQYHVLYFYFLSMFVQYKCK